MDDLPNTPQIPGQSPGLAGGSSVGSMAKESAPLPGSVEAPLVHETGKEAELAPEVTDAGVTMQADVVELPHVAQQMGVIQMNPSAVPITVPTTTLPLTDDQVAQGLRQSLLSSWRWLAQWCERQLKLTNVLLKSAHGKIVSTKK